MLKKYTKIIPLFCIFIAASCYAMKRQINSAEYASIKKRRIERNHVSDPIMPLELYGIIKDSSIIPFSHVSLVRDEDSVVPFTLPIELVYENGIASLSPRLQCHENKIDDQKGRFNRYTLCDRKKKTSDSYLNKGLHRHALDGFFDGIWNNKALLGMNFGLNFHRIRLLKQSMPQAGSITDIRYVNSMGGGEGVLKSLNFCDDQLFVCGIYNHDNIQGWDYSIEVRRIEDQGLSTLIARLDNQSLKKAIYLGNNTFLALNEAGWLFSFWLNDKNEIERRFQKTPQICSESNISFIDIDVDRSIKTSRGFMPRIAFLAKNGDVYETDLTCFEKPTFLYTNTISDVNHVKRLVYDKQQCSIFYTQGVACVSCLTWPARFNVMYMYYLAKRYYSQQQAIAENSEKQ